MMTFQEIEQSFNNLDVTITTDGVYVDVVMTVPETDMETESEVMTACLEFSDKYGYGINVEEYGRVIKMWHKLTGSQSNELMKLCEQLNELLSDDEIDLSMIIDELIYETKESIFSYIEDVVSYSINVHSL